MTKRIAFFAYGVVSYLFFLATFFYTMAWVGNFLVPTQLDAPTQGPLLQALLVDLGLLTLFAVQHSVMARPAFKRWWTRIVPEPIERSTYTLASTLCLALLVWQWQPLGGSVWEVTHPVGVAVMYGLFTFGWGLVLISTFLINHFDLFGLRQVWLHLLGREYTDVAFVMPGPYRWVRHPLYLGFVFALWFTPTMSVAHLLFALMCTGYILVGIQLQERDLLNHHGESYASYREQVPMLVPTGRRAAEPETGAAAV